MDRARLRMRPLLLDAWPLCLAVLLTLPLLTSAGLPLAGDLMFVSDQPWTQARIGLADAAPRAVPLDAVISTANLVVDGEVLARIVLPLVLAVAGWGAHRMLRGLGTLPRLAAAGLAVWNPYVVERLALGQWALLAGYAALPWLVMASRRFREDGRLRDLASVVLWAALATLTPTGGLLAVATAVVVGFTRGRRVMLLIGATLVLQLTWLVPALTGPATLTSDSDGVAAFAARAEGVGGAWLALIGLGGIWDAHSVPATRETWLAALTALLVVVVLVAGWTRLRLLLGSGDTTRLAILAGAGLVLAMLSTTPLGADLVRWAVAEVPGAGLLRDAQKFLAPFVLLVALALGATADRLLSRAGRFGTEVRLSAAMVLVLGPLVLLPDGASTTWRTVDPVTYPAGFAEVASVLSQHPGRGDLVTLPWRSYRTFDWGNDRTSADPASRWFATPVVAPDDLVVNGATIEGESIRARNVGAALEGGPPAAVLPELGVAWVLVYRDDPEAADLDLTGLERVYEDSELALYAVPEPVQATEQVAGSRRAAVVTADLLALALVGWAAVTRVGAAARARRRSR